MDTQTVTFEFITADGSRQQVEGRSGDTVMRVAYDNDIEGIVAECGGSMSCGTCHIYLDQASFERIDAPSANEVDMLDIVSSERRATSRLSCQVAIDERFEGAEVTVPASQF